MYGKFFSSCFSGSMAGAGPDVFAVWGYVIANAKAGQIELNPLILGAIIGMTPERVEAAITFLCSPDPKSRNQAQGGRRLLLEHQYAYLVVSHSIYSQMRNEDERREYNRDRQRQHRAKAKVVTPVVNDVSQKSMTVAHVELEEDVDQDSPAPLQGGAEREREREEAEKTLSPPPGLVPAAKAEENGEGKQQAAGPGSFLASLGAIILDPRSGADLLPEWKAVCKGLGRKDVSALFAGAAPAIQWPSDFKRVREYNRV